MNTEQKGYKTMSVSDKIKALLSIKGKKHIELAKYFGISAQSMNNKLSRGSFSAEDLIRVADFLGCTLAFQMNDNQAITLELSDIRANNSKAFQTKELEPQTVEPIPQKTPLSNATPQSETPQTQYKLLTDVERSKIDIKRLNADIIYQFELGEIYGLEQLKELLYHTEEQSELPEKGIEE